MLKRTSANPETNHNYRDIVHICHISLSWHDIVRIKKDIKTHYSNSCFITLWNHSSLIWQTPEQVSRNIIFWSLYLELLSCQSFPSPINDRFDNSESLGVQIIPCFAAIKCLTCARVWSVCAFQLSITYCLLLWFTIVFDVAHGGHVVAEGRRMTFGFMLASDKESAHIGCAQEILGRLMHMEMGFPGKIMQRPLKLWSKRLYFVTFVSVSRQQRYWKFEVMMNTHEISNFLESVATLLDLRNWNLLASQNRTFCQISS